MSLSDEREIRRVAALARIRLETAEASLFASQLRRVTEWMDELAQAAVRGDGLVARGEGLPEAPDLPEACLERSGVGANAPAWEEGVFFAVPRAVAAAGPEEP